MARPFIFLLRRPPEARPVPCAADARMSSRAVWTAASARKHTNSFLGSAVGHERAVRREAGEHFLAGDAQTA
jgi:hypothetical protein